MLQAMFSGVSGLQAHQSKMNVIGNNIANVNTTGFKSGQVSFQDQLSQTLRNATGPGGSSGLGGTNPTQVGLGVAVGAMKTNESQGNLQSTGNQTDLAVSGQGYFVVSDGNGVSYTRDGSFELDSNGDIVNSATGVKLLGYQADAFGNVDTSGPINANSTMRVPIGMLTDARKTQNISFSGNLNASAALSSTQVDFTGNLSSAAVAADQVSSTNTVFDSLGNAHTVETIFSNPNNSPSGAGTPAGSTQSWDVQIKVDSASVYNSAAGKSKIYKVGSAFEFADATGTSLGSALNLNGGSSLNNSTQVPGKNGAAAFSLSLNYNALTSTASTGSLNGVADGQTGASPSWGSSINIYDSLGVGHLITMKYTRASLGVTPPQGATTSWNWTAMENGQALGSSTTGSNTPLYFGSNGQLVGGASQTITITPTDGSISPFSVILNNNAITQLSSDSTAIAKTQDGYGVGTLQSFSISSNGMVNSVFTSGQTRSLGQIALASFSNPSGLEKLGNNMYRGTDNSGTAVVGVPNQSGRGKINPGYLEMSNVDLSSEFTNLIITQRGFQANSKIVTVIDELLQEVINMKR